MSMVCRRRCPVIRGRPPARPQFTCSLSEEIWKCKNYYSCRGCFLAPCSRSMWDKPCCSFGTAPWWNSWWLRVGYFHKPSHRRRQSSGCPPEAVQGGLSLPQAPGWARSKPGGRFLRQNLATLPDIYFDEHLLKTGVSLVVSKQPVKHVQQDVCFSGVAGAANQHPKNIRYMQGWPCL